MTFQKQLRAHCINRKQRAAAGMYIDKIEGAMRDIVNAPSRVDQQKAIRDAEDILETNSPIRKPT